MRDVTPILPPQPLLYSIAELAVVLGVSKRLLERVLAGGDLSSLKLGGRRVIPRASAEAWLQRSREAK